MAVYTRLQAKKTLDSVDYVERAVSLRKAADSKRHY
jgi:hypothetical protein